MLGRLRAATLTVSRSTLRCRLALATAILHRPQFRMEPEKILMSTPNVTASTIEVANILLDIRAESPLTDLPDDKPDKIEQKQKRQRRKQKEKKAPEPVEQTDVAARKPKQSRKKNVETDDGQVEGQEEAGKPKRVRKRKTATQVDSEDFGETEKKKRRRKTPEEDKVYEIPPVENTLTTTFKGRLGYACLNSLLRKYSTSIFCSRTCRLATLAEMGPAHVRALAMQNLADLHTLVKWNVEHGIFFMRMSSEMFPFASHPEVGYTLEFADAKLKEIGETARELGVRLTTHPGQFTQLGSLSEKVVANAFRDLTYHCEIMDRMGLDQDSVMIIHMGGVFGDKEATLARFRGNYAKLPSNVKGRLVLENDELCYNVDDLLPLCQELHIPIVFDYHHDWIYPSSRPPAELIPDINRLWLEKGIKPKQHYSEPRPGAETVMQKRAHSDRVAKLPDDLPDDMDLMLECKDKEQAVFHIYRLYNLRSVDPRVLRPPAPEETLHTNGRKSNKRAKAKAAAKAAAEVAADFDSDVNEDTAEVMGELEMEVKREAEEHGVPAGVAKEAIEDVKSEGELDCGSGDSTVVIDAGVKKSRKRTSQHKQKKGEKGRGSRARRASKAVV